MNIDYRQYLRLFSVLTILGRNIHSSPSGVNIHPGSSTFKHGHVVIPLFIFIPSHH